VIGVDKNTATSIARGGSVVIKAENVVLQDQYGRTMDSKLVKGYIGKGYQIKVESELPEDKTDASPFTVAINSAISSVNDTVKYGNDNKSVIIEESATTVGKTFAVQIKSKCDDDLDAYNKLNSAEKISFSLLKFNERNSKYELVAGSEKIVTFSKVTQSEFVKYEVDDLGVMYNDAKPGASTNAAYKKTVSVYGIKEDGTKVAIPKEYFEVTTDAGKKLTVNDNEITDATSDGFTDTDFKENGADNGKVITKTVKVSVAVRDYVSNAVVTTIVKELVLSKDDPKIATIGFKSESDDSTHFVEKAKATAHATSGIITDLGEYIKAGDVKDQYGVENSKGAKESYTITISDITKVDDSAFSVEDNSTAKPVIYGATLGDKFKATYTYKGGKSEVVSFTVGADSVASYKPSAEDVTTQKAKADTEDIKAIVNTLTGKNFKVASAVDVSTEDGSNLLTLDDSKGTTVKVLKDTVSDNDNLLTVTEDGSSVLVKKLTQEAEGNKTATFTVEVSKGKGVSQKIKVKVSVASGAQAYTVSVVTE
ncbi:MAG: hypothetical protein MR409_05680, partial [Lachnospiraceae bacterium]|nr:hypothetical protein [Lachnospiraceae bacterium]